MIWPFRVRNARTTSRGPSLRVECLEDRSVPAPLSGGTAFTPNAFGGGNFSPFGTFAGNVQTASGDVNGDGVADIITAQGAGAGSGSRVRIFDGASARFGSRAVVIADFFAYSNVAGAGQMPGFAGGVFVAAGDLNGDGFAEVITSPGAGASGHIKVFDFNGGATGFLGSNPALRASFFAYPGFLGAIQVATVNQTNGRSPLLVTASGAGTTQSDIRMFNNAFNIGQVGTGTFVQPTAQTFPFPGFNGGVSVAGGNANQLFVGTNVGQSVVRSFNLAGTGFGGTGFGGGTLSPGLAFSPVGGFQRDSRLGSADINGDGIIDVLTGFPGSGGTSISPFSLANGGATSLGGLSGFQGFGMFGGTWVSSGSFTGSTLIGPSASGNQGLNNGNPVFFNSAGTTGRPLAPGVQ